MSFNGDEGKMVTVEEATAWAAAYRISRNFDGVNAHFFGKNKISAILDQRDCVGIRIYKGIDGSTPVLMLVGADSEENDILSGDLILERGTACPPFCGGGGSPLQG